MKEFFETVRAASKSAIWSRGVALARENAVTLDASSDSEKSFRVKVNARPITPSVTLYLVEKEWSCDCGDEQDPCEHVIACAIALKEATLAGVEVPAGDDVDPRLGYRLERRHGKRLAIHRVVIQPDGTESPLQEPLARLLAARRLPLQPSHEDLEIDRLLLSSGIGATRAGTSHGLSAEGYERVLRALQQNRNVTLDGLGVNVDMTAIAPTARVFEQTTAEKETEIHVSIPLPDIEVLDRGIGLRGKTLHPLAATEFCGQRWEKLPLNRGVHVRDTGELVTRILPEIEKYLVVSLETSLLPERGGAQAPRIAFDLTSHGHTLSVLPTLVYGDPPCIRVDGERVVHLTGAIPRRNQGAEKDLLLRLRAELELVTGRVVHFDGNDAAKFAKRLTRFQENSRTSVSKEIISKSPLLPRIRFDGDLLSVGFSTDGDAPRSASFEQAYRAYKDGLEVVPLEDGGFAPLPAEWMARFGARVADILAASRPDGTMPVSASLAVASLCEELGEPPPLGLERLRPLLSSFEGLPERKLPDALPVKLRPYQEIGVRWLGYLSDAGLGAVLADDMGLGKTLQALCVAKPGTLVVCPKSVVFNWASEIQRFRPDLSVNIYHGPKRKLDTADVTVTTYAVLRLDNEALLTQKFTMVVLDEAQAIKNPDSQSARAAFALTDNLPDATFRVALSGTPVENRLDELWSLFRFTHPGLLGSRRDFAERLERPINDGQPGAVARLRKLTKPFLLRRMKKEVATDLPPRTDVILRVELEDEQRKVYDAVRALTQKEVMEALAGSGGVMAALTALLRLRQAACHPCLVPGIKVRQSAKLDALLEAVRDATIDEHKCIIFSQWTSFLDLVEEQLNAEGIGFVRLDGTTTNRGEVVAQFQADNGPPVFLSSLKAGGTGLNLTAADHVFLMDPWWNPAAEDQAADRAHRIGQDRPVTVYRLIAKDTVEEGILSLQERKRSLAELALEEGGAAAQVTKEDLMALLEN